MGRADGPARIGRRGTMQWQGMFVSRIALELHLMGIAVHCVGATCPLSCMFSWLCTEVAVITFSSLHVGFR